MLFLSHLLAILSVRVLLSVEESDVNRCLVIVELLLCELFTVDWLEEEGLNLIPVRILALIAPSPINNGPPVRELNLDLDIRLHHGSLVHIMLILEVHRFASVFDIFIPLPEPCDACLLPGHLVLLTVIPLIVQELLVLL